jgi:hypothetical protein
MENKKDAGRNFTPGPWRIENGTEIVGARYVANVCKWDITGAAGQYAKVEAGLKAERLANAALIAAAPELLAALEHAAKIINGEWGHDLSEGSMSGVPQDIRAAIAKAKGETPRDGAPI